MSEKISQMLDTLKEIKSDNSSSSENKKELADGGRETTILDAALTYAELGDKSLGNVYDSSIGINQTGERFEYFVKDVLADSFDKESKEEKDATHNRVLSWLGSQNNPPDAMIRGGEAIEVKKSRGKHTQIALNSSPPRQRLKNTTTRITEDCRACEDELGGWNEKDLVYVMGSGVTKQEIDFLWVVYGDCWCASNDTYINVAQTIRQSLSGALDKLSARLDTSGNELGKVRDADAHNRASMRMRSMWHLKHPATELAEYIEDYETKISNGQPMFTVMRETTYNNHPKETRKAIEKDENITVNTITLPDPEDTDSEISCKLIESE